MPYLSVSHPARDFPFYTWMPYALLGSQPGWSERPHGMGSTKMAITTGCLGGFSSILVVSPRWKEIPSIHCWLFRRSVVIVPDFASDPRSRFPISMFLTFLTLSHPAFSPCFPLFSLMKPPQSSGPPILCCIARPRRTCRCAFPWHQ